MTHPSPTNDGVLRCDGVGFDRQTRAGAWSLGPIDLEPRAGAVTALIGPNGAGKSTLLRLMLGALAPARGEVLIGGRAVDGLDPKERAGLIAFVAQSPATGAGHTVRELVAMGRLRRPRDDGAVDEAIGAMDLRSLADRRADGLSGGELQRTAIARALAQLAGEASPGRQTLLADEPAAWLDPVATAAIWTMLRRQAGLGRRVVVAAHDVNAASRWADEVIALSAEGSVVASGPIGDALSADLLGTLYGGAFRSASLPGGGDWYYPDAEPRAAAPKREA